MVQLQVLYCSIVNFPSIKLRPDKYNKTLNERENENITNLFHFCLNLVKSTLGVPVGQSGQKWYHWLCLVFGHLLHQENCQYLYSINHKLTMALPANHILSK